jgi:hypothetical protein
MKLICFGDYSFLVTYKKESLSHAERGIENNSGFQEEN